MLTVVSYDIADDKRRVKVAKTMEDFGIRVQYSVFECTFGEERFLKLKKALAKLIDHTDDSVRFYRLCERDRRTVEVLGRGTVQDVQDVVIL